MPRAQVMNDYLQGWPQYKSLFSDPRNAASQPTFVSAIVGGDQGESSSQSQLLLNEKVLVNANLLNISNRMPPNIYDEIAAPNHPNFNINSSPENVAKSTPQLAPVTPDKYKGTEDGQPPGDIDFGKKRENEGKEWEKEPIQLCLSEEPSSQQLEIQNQQKQAIDLNQVPPKMPRRKKHRPKVIREGKPVRTPKPVTPKQAGEEPRIKRKYVRKKGVNSPMEIPSSVGEAVEPEGRKAKPVRRSLNFDGGGQSTDRCQETATVIESNTRCPSQEECIQGNNTGTSTKSTFVVTQEMEVVVENSPTGAMFDLNCISQIPDGLNPQENPAPAPAPAPAPELARRPVRIKSIARTNHMNIVPIEVQDDQRLSFEGQTITTSASILPSAGKGFRTKGSKRDYNLTASDAHPHYMDMVGANFELGQICNEIDGVSANQERDKDAFCFPKICKKRRTRGHNTPTSYNASSMNYSHPGVKEHNHVVRKASKVFSSADAKRMETEKLWVMGARQVFGQTGHMTKKRSKTPIRVCDLASLAANLQCDRPPATQSLWAHDEKQRSEIICGSQACTVVSGCNLSKKYDESTSSLPVNSQQYHLLQGKPAQDHQSSGDFQEALYANYLFGELVPYVDPVDVIVQKMKYLTINEAYDKDRVQAQTALVPYGGHGMLVPIKGRFGSIKKRRPRAKVDLDVETNRVWKLLMGKDISDEVEGTDMDKEKWWEEERRVFRGRADSFIARMHLIQGDRRFSKWKGSVVDSVVGVFLTQNVSDHLSSSAFMALAARFPPKSRGKNAEADHERLSTSGGQQEVSTLELDSSKKTLHHQACDQGSTVTHEAENMIEKEMRITIESLRSCMSANLQGKYLANCGSVTEISHAFPEDVTDTAAAVTASTNLAGVEDRRSLEDVLSSQNSVVSSQNSSDYMAQTTDRIGPSSESNSEAENPMTGNKHTHTFTELLQMAETSMFHEFYNSGNGRDSTLENCDSQVPILTSREVETTKSSLDKLNKLDHACPAMTTSFYNSCHFNHATSVPCNPFPDCYSQNVPDTRFEEMENIVASEKGRTLFDFTASDITNMNGAKTLSSEGGFSAENTFQVTNDHKSILASENAPAGDSHVSTSNLGLPFENHLYCQDRLSRITPQGLPSKNSSHNHSKLPDNVVQTELKEREANIQVENIWNVAEALTHMRNSGVHQPHSCSLYVKETSEVVESTSVVGKGNSMAKKPAEFNPKEDSSSGEVLMGTTGSTPKAKRGKVETEKKKSFDWDSLRKQACCNGAKKERCSDWMDSLDWDAVRNADVRDIANAIRERGMNNMLAERIKDFLDRLVREHGSIDLEWLRDVPPDKAKDFLLSVRGLGLKSVECVRLLTLHHLAFPVDTNVGRICVRLGWVPLQPLPESLQLHLLELYPMLETIQKYLWPRLCTLDQRTLYELHYQMITFGKVFCTKSKPNCNACPMRGECKHFASAFASARLALPGPEEKSLVSSTIPIASEQNYNNVIKRMPPPQLEGNPVSQAHNCEPIIEEPATPEPEDISESAIEDAFYEDPDEIPTIKLNFEEFSQNLQNYMQENNMELQDDDMSKALVALTPEAASIPMPKLKNVSRLRTEHQVYELPDSHPLLEGLDHREPDDPCPYLLAIWTPGETAQSIEPPEICCNSQDTGNLCNNMTCFSCNSIREANAQKIRGTLLIPCRTAMRGSFPLNGTYFQVNEVFADHDSSITPIDVPTAWIWNLPRRTVYFGTSIPSIFKGLTTEGIQYCFWRGFVCVRGFDQRTRAPRPLLARLHFPASKATRAKRAAATKGDDR